jgi:cytochrome c553
MRLLASLAVVVLVAGCGQPTGKNAAAPAKPKVQFEQASANQVEHGQRVARVLGCFGCHGPDLTGEDWSEPGFGKLWTANLTQSVPRYSDEQLASIIRGGARPDGAELWEMPSHLFTKLTVDDMAALIAFLRSKPPTGAIRPSPVFEEGARREMAAGTFQVVADAGERRRQQVASRRGRAARAWAIHSASHLRGVSRHEPSRRPTHS